MDEHLGQIFVKRTSLPCHVAFFSTTQVGLTPSGMISPPQVTNKVVLPWRFTKEEVRDLIPSMITMKFDDTTIYKNDEVVDTLFSLFCGHRGMTVLALDYIAGRMKKDNLLISKFNREVCYRYLCEMMRKNEGAMQSRAISINGGGASSFPYSEGYNQNIRSLVEMAVSIGEVPSTVANKVPHDIARCVTLGALVSKDMWAPPTTAVRIQENSAYCVSNPFLLKNLAKTVRLDKKRMTPTAFLPAEVILSGISHISYDTLFSAAGSTTLANRVWVEEYLNAAIKDGINLAFAPKTARSVYSSKKEEENPDMIFGDFVIECVVYNNDVKGHYKRFWSKEEYIVGKKDRHGLLVVYCSGDQLKAVKSLINSIVKEEVPILVVINFAFNFAVRSFETHFIQKHPSQSPSSILTKVKTDLSFYSFDSTRCEFLPSQKLKPELEKKIANMKPIPPVSVWTRLSSGGPAFRVTPTEYNIDSLKYAIKEKISPKYPMLIAPDITILEPDTKKPVDEPDQPLEANSAPYLFELPMN